MINIKDLSVDVEWKNVLKNIDAKFEIWKNYCMLWENGSGKSSLSATIMWHPKYEVRSWEIIVEGEDILEMTPDERSTKWIFLAFQNVPEIKWIKMSEYLRTIYNTHLANKNPEIKPISPFIFKRFIKKFLDELNIKEEFLDRDLNVGFSGWEKRKIEILQMKLIEPKYIILDEIDSGLDLDAIKLVSELIENVNNENNTFIVITHNFSIINKLPIDKIYIVKSGEIVKTWNVNLIEEVKEKWYKDL